MTGRARNPNRADELGSLEPFGGALGLSPTAPTPVDPSSLTPAQREVREHRSGALLLRGPAASGKTEAVAHRLAAMKSSGIDLERVLVLTTTDAAATRLRLLTEAMTGIPGEDLPIGTWTAIGERLLREEATAAGLDPFFDVLGPAERLALLHDRLDELPLRLHEIRGDPIGLLRRLVARIDSLKADGVGSEELTGQATRLAAEADDEADRESAAREREFAELFEIHDRVLADRGSIDRGQVDRELLLLLNEETPASDRLRRRFTHLVVEELEEVRPARWALLAALAEGCESLVAGLEEDADRNESEARFLDLAPKAGRVTLAHSHRSATRVRFWRCANERAEAQAAAREIEELLAGGAPADSICILVDSPAHRGTVIGSALEERSIPFGLAEPGALFRRPEVRDAIAWLRCLADPDDSAATARALTRPPIQLGSADLARLTTIARRRKLDLVSAGHAALESPQFQPEGRERIEEFLRLHRSASTAMDERRADVFVRRLIERVGLRRQRMFAASAEVAERLMSRTSLAEIATAWSRHEPHGTTRDFVGYLSAVAEAGTELGAPAGKVPPGAVPVMAIDRAKGYEFRHVYVLGLTDPSVGGDRGPATAVSRSREEVVLSWHEAGGGSAPVTPSAGYVEARSLIDAEEEVYAEELFGPGEGLHATYRMLREDVLEASWKAGRQLFEPRLDTAVDLDRAIARYLELLKLAALAQRPDTQPISEAIEDVDGLLRQVATSGQLAELEASALDQYLLDEDREYRQRRSMITARQEPSLEEFLPRRGEGLRMSATDLDLYLTCPLKYKFARVFALPREPTINQRFGILIHGVLDRFHRDIGAGEIAEPSSLAHLSSLFESGWRRSGFGTSDDELQFQAKAREAIRRYWERERESESEPIWLEKPFEFRIGPHHVRGRADRVDLLPSGEHELIDYKTGLRKSHEDLRSDLQLSLYRLGAARAWGIEAGSGSYYYVLDAEKVRVEPQPDDAERVERTVKKVGEGVLSQDFEPRPSPSVCAWCDYRLVCPAAEE